MAAAVASTVTVRVLGDATNLAKTFSGVEGVVSASVNTVSGKGKQAEGALGGVAQKAEKTGSAFQNAGGGLAKMAEGFAAFEAAKSIVDTFNEDQKAAAALNNAMRDSGQKVTPEFTDALENARKAGENLGFGNAETAQSVAQLVRAGVDANTALKDQATIMDLARARNLSLSDATDQVVLAMQGSGRALKTLNVEMPPHLATTAALDKANQALTAANDKATASWAKYNAEVKKYGANSKQAHAAYDQNSKDNDKLEAAQEKVDAIQKQLNNRTGQLAQVMDTLHKKVGGAAQAAASTASGQWHTFTTKLKDTGAELMTNLLPAATWLIGKLSDITSHSNIVVPAIFGVVGAFIAWKTAMLIGGVIDGVTKGIKGIGVAMDFLAANPIVLVIIAIAAIVAALVALELKFHWIETAVGAMGAFFGKAFGAIKQAVLDALNWIKSNWPIIVDILTGPFGLVVTNVITHFGQIKDFITGLPGNLAGAFENLGGFLANGFKDVIDTLIIDPINSALRWIGDLGGGIGPFSVHVRDAFGGTMPQLPRLHSGGVVPGSAGQEVMAVLKAGEVVTSNDRRSARGGGMGTTVNQHFYNSQVDARAAASEIAWLMLTGRA